MTSPQSSYDDAHMLHTCPCVVHSQELVDDIISRGPPPPDECSLAAQLVRLR